LSGSWSSNQKAVFELGISGFTRGALKKNFVFAAVNLDFLQNRFFIVVLARHRIAPVAVQPEILQ